MKLPRFHATRSCEFRRGGLIGFVGGSWLRIRRVGSARVRRNRALPRCSGGNRTRRLCARSEPSGVIWCRFCGSEPGGRDRVTLTSERVTISVLEGDGVGCYAEGLSRWSGAGEQGALVSGGGSHRRRGEGVDSSLFEPGPDRYSEPSVDCCVVRGGLRLAEALALQAKDVDPDAGTLTVLHGKGDRRRTVGIDPGAMAIVLGWVDIRKTLNVSARGPVVLHTCGEAALSVLCPDAAAASR